MGNGFRHESAVLQQASLRVDPKVVLSGQMLEMNMIELRSMIEIELQENPALEWLDDGIDGITHDEILESIAPDEFKPGSEDREFQRSQPNDCLEADWIDLAASWNSIEDHLEAQLIGELSDRQMEIASILVSSLDNRGYLDADLDQVALDGDFDPDEVALVLRRLQTCEPSGVGARDIRECLMIQLAEARTVEERLALEIITHAFDELVNRDMKTLVRRFKAIPELVQAAFDVIMGLHPFPADAFGSQQCISTKARSVSVPVDLVISRTETGWEARVPGVDPRDLIVARAYRDRLSEVEHRRGDDEKRHLQTYVGRANQFIEALKSRQATLLRIGYYLIEFQSGFVTTGDYAFLRSMTRRKIADSLGLHESTISRATAGKHVQLANGEVVSFEVFFKPALRVQQMIAEIVASEQPGEIYSDEKIAQLLAERGVVVARRTVNKYRDRSKMLSSRRRRTA